MHLPQVSTIRVVRPGHPLGGKLVRHVCETRWIAAATELKRTGRSLVLRGPGLGTTPGTTPGSGAAGRVLVKALDLSGPRDRLASWLGLSKLDRQWRGAQRLVRAGFATPEPLVQFLGRSVGHAGGDGPAGKRVGCLVLAYVEGRTLLEVMARPGSQEPVPLARAVGTHVGLMLRAGLFNRDHKPSNLLVPTAMSEPTSFRTNVRDADGRGAVVVLDPVGVRRVGRSTRALARARRRMLFALLVEPLGVGIEVGLRSRLETMHACAAVLGLPRRVVREDFRAIDQMLFEHGDPTPEHDPLASADEHEGRIDRS